MRKNVLFLSTWYPNRMNTLNGIFIRRHADCFSKVANITTLTVQLDKELPFFKLELAEVQNRGYKTITVYYGNTLFGTLGKYFQIIRAYYKGIIHINHTGFDYDLIHAHVTIHAGIIAKILSRWSGKPYIITEHSSLYDINNPNKAKKLFYILAAWACKGAKYLLPVSQSLMRGMRKYKIRGKYVTLSNVVDTKIFNITDRDKKNVSFTFLHISGLDRDIKNPEGIIDAVKLLSNSIQDFKMIIAGNDKGKRRLKDYADSIEIPPDLIEYYGYLPEKSVAALMQRSHVFILNSNFETQGCVLLEALCCGIPIIGTNVGEISELKDIEALGIIIPPNQPEKLSAAMKQMILNYEKYDAKLISQFANSRYAMEQIALRIQTIYAST